MPTAILDRVTTLTATEHFGVLMSCRREALITGLTDQSVEALFSAINAVGLTAGSYLPNHRTLVLTGRNPSLVPGETDKMTVELVYEHFMNGGQNIRKPALGKVFIRSSNTLQQVTVNKYPDDHWMPELQNDLFGLSYTYPNDHKKWPGQTVSQTGEISALEVQRTLVLDGIYETDRPQSFADKCLRHVNKELWRAGAPRTWLCTVADIEELDSFAEPRRKSKIHFEWQYKPGGWDFTILFVDPDTGKPPIDIDPNTTPASWKTIQYYPEVDFKRFFNLLQMD